MLCLYLLIKEQLSFPFYNQEMETQKVKYLAPGHTASDRIHADWFQGPYSETPCYVASPNKHETSNRAIHFMGPALPKQSTGRHSCDGRSVQSCVDNSMRGNFSKSECLGWSLK